MNCSQKNSIQIPESIELKGELIILRHAKSEDFEALRRIHSDLKTMECLTFMAFAPQGWTLEQVEKTYELRKKAQVEQRGLHWVIHHRKSGSIVGTAGFGQISLRNKNAEFGLIIDHPFWGSGICTEVHRLALAYGFEKLLLHRIEFFTDGLNSRMKRFFEKVGIQLEGIKRDSSYWEGRYSDTYEYGLLEQEWPAVKNNLSS